MDRSECRQQLQEYRHIRRDVARRLKWSLNPEMSNRYIARLRQRSAELLQEADDLERTIAREQGKATEHRIRLAELEFIVAALTDMLRQRRYKECSISEVRLVARIQVQRILKKQKG